MSGTQLATGYALEVSLMIFVVFFVVLWCYRRDIIRHRMVSELVDPCDTELGNIQYVRIEGACGDFLPFCVWNGCGHPR